MKLILSFFSLVFVNYSQAQTWSDNVAEIVYNKCTKCHHTGGAGPFSLTTYSEASPMAAAMAAEINSGNMPPWPPDNNYATFTHDRSLTASEKSTILDWVLAGAPEGIPANTPPPPVFTSSWELGGGDLTVRMPNYSSHATPTQDDYVCIVIPSNLAQGRSIRAVEVLPGNSAILHHCLVFVEPPGGTATTDTVGGNCGSPNSTTANMVYGWAPGSTPFVFPSGAGLKLGMSMPANSKIILAMHYPGGSAGIMDSTKVRFHFYPNGETGIREVFADPLLQNWVFSLPPGQITSLSNRYPTSSTTNTNFSLLSIFPHMHQIGKSIKVYGIKPAADTLKLMNLPEWNFDWQGFYTYNNIKKLPAGSYLKQEAVYNNTTNSTVNPGLNTTDEMMLTYFHFLPYVSGDENFDIAALTQLGLNEVTKNYGPSNWEVYPNPFNKEVEINFSGFEAGQLATLLVYDTRGNLVSTVLNKQPTTSTSLSCIWNGKNSSGNEVSPGMYMLSLNVGGKFYMHRVAKN